ncbi:ATP-binding protein [Schlesneria sp. DSM 10557]|uniref:ATP-binding protein n=1 Tax=Schlesneria sp. DSM 10557 TaxID=3044399 RepID=UPI00359F6B5A
MPIDQVQSLASSPEEPRKLNLSYDIDARTEINVRGVIALRWVAVSGQLLTILAVQGLLGVSLPLRPLLMVLGLTSVLNVGLMIAHRIIPARFPGFSSTYWQQVLGLTMAFDLAALTALLYLTGGISNPFTSFFFVNIVLAAILLPQGWVWFLTLLGIGCVALLNSWYRPLAELDPAQAMRGALPLGMTISRLGSFVAYAACSSIIVLFITRIRGQIQRLEDHIRELAQENARNERLDSLGTLAAGAAHELATPLSTIAVIMKEVELELMNRTVSDQTVADIALIRTELDRCRDILDRMSSDAGLVIGESISTITLGELIRECIEGVDTRAAVKLAYDPAIESLILRAPIEGLAQAVRALVKNAIDAAGHPQKVTLYAATAGFNVTMKIEDQGAGIAPETLRRIGEPFFTTKEPGKGMGLGVYLARNVVERLGGTLEYSSKPGRGTVVSISIPREVSQDRSFSIDPLGNTTGLF